MALCISMAGCVACKDAILDGEIVHVDAEGKPQFYDLVRRRSPRHVTAFDVLWLDGRDLRARPLFERKRIPRSIVPVNSSSILYASFIDGAGTGLFDAVCRVDTEGVVAKRKDGQYDPAETSWFKIRKGLLELGTTP